MSKRQETVREVCFEVETLTDITLKEGGVFLPREVSAHFERFLSAYEREMEAKDAEIEHLKHALETIKKSREEVRSDYQHLLGIRDARIALLERALNDSPHGVIYQLGITDDEGNCYYGCAIKFDNESESVKMPRVAQGDRFIVVPINAVREAQLIMKESYNGESHN